MVTEFKKEISIIKKFKISNAELSRVLGCSTGNFSDKLNGKPGHRFTDDQQKEIRKYLKKLAN
ncbi:MAG: hypothetical protein KA161_07715, partial [Saprospiraceae bacterium]|nr:hypothetical protein [Saprospiraceae bacterium]